MPYFEIGMPERILIINDEQYKRYLKLYNGVKNLYYTTYKFSEIKEGKPDMESVHFDKAFFDFDEDDCYTKTLTFHEYLREKNLKHEILLSGRGFHLILYLKNGEKIKNKKQCLTNLHNYFNKKFSLNLDIHVIGDLARLRRIPNTLNLKNKRYCIYLNGEDLSNGFDFIKKKAEKPNKEHTIFGKYLLDAEEFKDKDDITFNGIEVPEYKYELKEEEGDKIFNSLPPCVRLWISDENFSHYDARYFACLYCKNIGLPKEITMQLMKKYLSRLPDKKWKTKLGHLLKHKTCTYAYSRTNDIMPSCEIHYKSGRCRGRCKWFKEKDFPLLI